MRLVLDTNVLVSGLLFPGGPPSRLVKAWRAGAFDLVISDFVIEELVRTWGHLAPRLKVAPNDLADFLDALHVRAELLRTDADMLSRAAAAGLRDPNDVPILAMLIGSGADFLVSGDKDLLALAGAYPILSPADFVGRFVP
ncbi:MAG: putative toxin-antitoxin system toxin component, PIN family [Burkholderiaceae bacterium]|nr:putative toxin-antitoxin system toxin component, PIN family [Burkholderiaceae bacterium]